MPHRPAELSRRAFLRSAGALGAVAVGAGFDRRLLLPPARPRGVPARRGRGDGPGPATTAFMDPLWDEQLGQIRFPFEQQPPPVRETVWYAIGLLQRAGAGDQARARRALDTVAGRQYDRPGSIFHGSFPRYAGDPPEPPPDAVPFVQFDPNWRQFIATAFALAVGRFGDRLGGLRADLEAAIDRAAAGEQPDRVEPDYSNIAIMHAWLLAYTGARGAGEDLALAVAGRYRDAGALDEYNSPTYDGVALYGLALWRDEPPSPRFARLGDELWRGVWRNLARAYHARLRNVCGPYSRAVGMDLRTYASVAGLWIWAAVGAGAAPFPDLAQPFEHAGDVCWGPLVELLAGDIPRSARRRLARFEGERTVRVGVADAWEATSWLGEDVMVGGRAGDPVRVGGAQIHPATVHWREGWIRILGPLDAVATTGQLDVTIAPPGPGVVTIGVPGLDPAAIGSNRWELPGLVVEVTGPAPSGAAQATTEGIELSYPPGTLRLVCETRP